MASRFFMGTRKSDRFVLSLAPALGLIVTAWSATGIGWERKPPPRTDAIESFVVRRDDLKTTLIAGGVLHPTKQTLVTCQVEDITDSEGLTILSVIQNGALVKKGDELCRLDSSQLEEMAREEEIAVNQARAECIEARLVLETSRIALRAYEEGEISQSTKEFNGRMALGRSDTQRGADRVAWTEGMVAKGYLSQSQLSTERQNLAQARHELLKTEGEFQLFRRFQVPKEMKTLRSQIEMAAITHRVVADRLKVWDDRLAYVRKQIENCTVRAPQDGVVIYARGSVSSWLRERGPTPPLEPGAWVIQDQVLFVLPDLTEMEVEVSVHESMGSRVQVGMKADVRIASKADRVLAGRVVAITLLPIPDWRQGDDRVQNFLARVRLDKTPPGVLPFMSAVVEFDTGRVVDALVIPVEAMSLVDGQHSCYVVVSNHLERRAITTRRATTDLLEVTGGLTEGERVLVRSLNLDGNPVYDEVREPEIGLTSDRNAPISRSGPQARSMAQAW